MMQSQEQEPIAVFLGGKFVDVQNWTTYEKDAFPIVQTFEEMEYLLWSARPEHVFTDHRNLLYVLFPLAQMPNYPRYVLSEVNGWAILRLGVEFMLDHLEGADNVFADGLTRWVKRYRKRAAHQSKMVAALIEDIVTKASRRKQVAIDDVKMEQG